MYLYRRSKNYILLAGLWCSVRKPPSFGFLEPVCEQLNELESKSKRCTIARLLVIIILFTY